MQAGRVEEQNAYEMIQDGGRVIVGTPDVFTYLVAIGDASWKNRICT